MRTQGQLLEAPSGNLDKALNAMILLLNEGKREWCQIMAEVGKISSNLEKLTTRVYQIEDWSRKPFPKAIIRIFIEVINKFYNGMCPCCNEIGILNPVGGKNEYLQVDHFKGPKWNKITEGWPICDTCHEKLTYGHLSRDGGWVEQAFKAFQMRVRQHTTGHDYERQRQIFKKN